MQLIYQPLQDRYVPDTWRVEAFAEDGSCYSVIFYGPESKNRSVEYAKFKNPF